eukprot:GHVH01014712.1.p1 GENE.GHVH01014712.1~~GHVH01014712.1.p1  ORF type:complete len:320 (-),score=33.34 GHVH01014712.1:513-1472(-)
MIFKATLQYHVVFNDVYAFANAYILMGSSLIDFLFRGCSKIEKVAASLSTTRSDRICSSDDEITYSQGPRHASSHRSSSSDSSYTFFDITVDSDFLEVSVEAAKLREQQKVIGKCFPSRNVASLFTSSELTTMPSTSSSSFAKIISRVESSDMSLKTTRLTSSSTSSPTISICPFPNITLTDESEGHDGRQSMIATENVILDEFVESVDVHEKAITALHEIDSEDRIRLVDDTDNHNVFVHLVYLSNKNKLAFLYKKVPYRAVDTIQPLMTLSGNNTQFPAYRFGNGGERVVCQSVNSTKSVYNSILDGIQEAVKVSAD